MPLQMLLGQQGINLIESVLLEMKCRWSATGAVDAGIDGTIELSDGADPPHPLGLVLHVQSRATDLAWPDESESGFTYHAREDELVYWLQGNAPVLLVLSRPRTREAYWVSIKDYFADPNRRRSRAIAFDKAQDRFDVTAYNALFELGRRYGEVDRGLYLASPRKTEMLTTNLVPVTLFGPRLFIAETSLRTRAQVFAVLKEAGETPSDAGVFLTTGKTLISPYDLREPPWPRVCELGTVEEFDAREWALSDDRDRQREYTALLRLALRELLYPHVRLWPDEDLYAFHAFGEARIRRFRFVVAGRRRNPSVVRVYTWTHEETEYTRLRHLAMRVAFRRSGQHWFIEITPSYLFTRDGRQIDKRHEDLLSGIKRLERQTAVLAHVQLWAAYLARPAELTRPSYPYLATGDLLTVNADLGIVDHAWREWDEAIKVTEATPAEILPEPLWS